jgi:hypothetical protein
VLFWFITNCITFTKTHFLRSGKYETTFLEIITVKLPLNVPDVVHVAIIAAIQDIMSVVVFGFW